MQTVANIARQMHAARQTVANFIHEDEELSKLHLQVMETRAMKKARKYNRRDDALHPLRTIWLSEYLHPDCRRVTGWKKYLKYPGAWKSLYPPK